MEQGAGSGARRQGRLEFMATKRGRASPATVQSGTASTPRFTGGLPRSEGPTSQSPGQSLGNKRSTVSASLFLAGRSFSNKHEATHNL
jgi:hypothetical protein